MKTYKLILLILINVLFFVGCEEYLDEAPSKSNGVIPSTVQDLEGLLNDRNTFVAENANEIIAASDDYGLNSNYFDVDPQEYNISLIHDATWNNEFPAFSEFHIWEGEWEKIFTANLVLEALDLVEGNADDKANLKAEAHFIRAYSYFLLANTYCLALKGNESELGLPIKVSTSFEESLERVSLEQTYNFITSDVEEALKITRRLEEKNGYKRIWRASTAAVNAFAARYYLALHDYDKAEQYAQNSLDEHNTLRNLNTDVNLVSQIQNIERDGDPSTTETATLLYPNFLGRFSGGEDKYIWEEFYYDREMVNNLGELYPSNDLLNLYDQSNDLRFQYFMVENHSYVRGADGIDNPLFSQTGYTDVVGSSSRTISGPSVPEMYLIVAECQVRKGNFASGLAMANILRRTRMDNSAPTSAIDLSASSQQEALTKILNERRRELPFVLRWYDLKRYNSNDDASDDVDNLTRSFYPYSQLAVDGSSSVQVYTLPKNSHGYARPIPNNDIVTSGGILKQNQY
ncbi:RagB/SusD family nutrient uptake outer membrane protein [Polaribacter staleyi]|uniref:RagB/SusD family nutrient uptake outer membrane protein n=1 Tax=Polaribacter staleyi TaxID=2022337 RepID=UPI0031BA87C1